MGVTVTTSKLVRGGADRVGVMALMVVTLTMTLAWVSNRVSAEMRRATAKVANINQKAHVAAQRVQTQRKELRAVIQMDKTLSATHAADLKALAVLNQEIVTMETRINQSLVKLDTLTHTPTTNLLPMTSISSGEGAPTVQIPSLPTAPPTVHTMTTASGAP